MNNEKRHKENFDVVFKKKKKMDFIITLLIMCLIYIDYLLLRHYIWRFPGSPTGEVVLVVAAALIIYQSVLNYIGWEL